MPYRCVAACISASVAESLAFAELDILYLLTNDPLDTRRRLGTSEARPTRCTRATAPGAGWGTLLAAAVMLSASGTTSPALGWLRK